MAYSLNGFFSHKTDPNMLVAKYPTHKMNPSPKPSIKLVMFAKLMICWVTRLMTNAVKSPATMVPAMPCCFIWFICRSVNPESFVQAAPQNDLLYQSIPKTMWTKVQTTMGTNGITRVYDI